jgi:hypothetical protein
MLRDRIEHAGVACVPTLIGEGVRDVSNIDILWSGMEEVELPPGVGLDPTRVVSEVVGHLASVEEFLW